MCHVVNKCMIIDSIQAWGKEIGHARNVSKLNILQMGDFFLSLTFSILPQAIWIPHRNRAFYLANNGGICMVAD